MVLINKTAENRFTTFHRNNPEVWRLFCGYTAQARALRPNYSARAIFHVIRWETMVRTRDKSGFKLCNDYSPYYVRMYHSTHSDANGFFRERPIRRNGRVMSNRELLGLEFRLRCLASETDDYADRR
jgi:hypothetical protein